MNSKRYEGLKVKEVRSRLSDLCSGILEIAEIEFSCYIISYLFVSEVLRYSRL